ncbi:MAG: hypothetical protein J3K34DRAFT_518892 [Monoraphidium minutum]|nr:MAG: hypothetical protein J3K34DRAFT_518892 [Monoraphidium minutum]
MGSLETMWACGLAPSYIAYVSTSEVAWQCSNAIVLYSLKTQTQRLLRCDGLGIHCFAACTAAGIIAVAERGPAPRIWVYRAADLMQLVALPPSAGLEVTALALSADGELLAAAGGRPRAALAVWQWRKEALLASAPLEVPASQVSFHPLDPGRLATTADPTCSASCSGAGWGGGAEQSAARVQLWRLERLWSTYHLAAKGGVYLGCTSGEVLLVDQDEGRLLASAEVTADAAAAGSAGGGRGSDAEGAAVSRLAVGADAVFVCGGGGAAPLRWFSRAAGGEAMQQLGQAQGTAGALCLDLGGPSQGDAIVSTCDGCLLLVSPGRPPSALSAAPASAALVEPLADCHAGGVAALAPLPGSRGHVLSAGADGSLRVWDAAGGGQIAGRRDFRGARLTALAACARHALVAAGSARGVLRLVSTADEGALPLVWRARLARGPLSALAFSPGGGVLAAACAAGGDSSSSSREQDASDRIAFIAVGPGSPHVGGAAAAAAPGGGAQLLGYAECGGRVLSMAWLPLAGGEAGEGELLVSLSSGLLLSLAAPTAAAQPAAPAAAAAGADEAAAMALPRAQLRARSIALEAPLAHIAAARVQQPAGGGEAAVVLGLSARDRRLHRFVLPPQLAAWGGAERLPLRSTAAVLAHAKPGAALALSPCGRVVASAGGDGSVGLRDATTLLEFAAAAPPPGSQRPRQQQQQQQQPQTPRAHASCSGGARALCFDAGCGWVASGGVDGSLFLSRVQPPPGALPPSGGADSLGPLPAALGGAAAEDAPDDAAEPLLPALLAAAAARDEEARGAAARGAAAAALEALRARLGALLARNAAAPEGERLSEEEVIVDVGRLQELRSEADAEASALREALADAAARDQIVAGRIKAEFWDSMQVKPAAVTGVLCGQEVWNFLLAAEDGARYAAAAALRGAELLEAAALGLGPAGGAAAPRPRGESAGAAPAACAADAAAPAAAGEASGAAAPLSARRGGAGEGGATADGAPTSPSPRACAVAAGAAGAAAAGAGAAAGGGEAADLLEALAAGRAVAPARLLYRDLEVTTPARKAAQAELYRRMARDLQAGFNAEFDALAGRKRGDAGRIADANARLDELERELAKISPAGAAGAEGGSSGGGEAGPAGGGCGQQARVAVKWAAVEDLEESVFSVKPEEIKAPKYQSAAARAAPAAEARRRAAADDAFGRALDDMMGGALVRAGDEVADLAAARPGWMNGNPQDFTEEQLREYKEYAAREKAAIEERVKRAAAMEQERRALRAAAEDVASKARFDEALAALARRRLDVLAELCSLQGRAARLEADAEAARAASEEAEGAALARAAEARERRAAVEKELADARAALAAQQERAAALHADEKAMDRALRREFHEADAPALARLTALYKARAAPPSGGGGGARGGGTGAGGVAGAGGLWAAAPAPAASPRQPLGAGGATPPAAASAAAAAALLGGGAPPPELLALEESQRPEGLEPAAWERFLDYRSRRGRLEALARDEASKAARAARWAAALESEAASLSAAAAAADADAAALRGARRAAALDLELRFRLQSGQVEAEPEGAEALLGGAVMVGRGLVEGLNGAVRAKGRQKVELLGQIKDFKHGIYAMQWANKRCEMEADDVAGLARELQLLHVTKDFQQLVKAGPGAKTSAAGKEVSSLEALLRTREELHAKRLEEGRRRVRKLEREIATKAQQNAEVQLHLSGLERILDEQARLQDAAVGERHEPHERRMCAAVVSRRLRDIAAAQADEIEGLRAEVARLEARTFPHFPDPAAAPTRRRGADERGAGAL